MDDRQLDHHLARLKLDFGASIQRAGAAFATGLTLRTGRALGIYLETTQAFVRVSDGGDAWNDLAMDGYTTPMPTSADRDKLDRLCELYGVKWDPARREVVALVAFGEPITNAVRGVIAAAVAIDGWAAWYPPALAGETSDSTIVRRLTRLAPRAGWQVEDRDRLTGAMHSWPIATLLSRQQRRAAVIITRNRRAEDVMQRTVGFLHDVPDAGLVLALPPRIAAFVEGAREFDKRVQPLPIRKAMMARAIVRAAEQAAV